MELKAQLVLDHKELLDLTEHKEHKVYLEVKDLMELKAQLVLVLKVLQD
tara:strand:+ start:7 stop:153 length:147 start_codon:yes stop_codon:yes gene_type:complete